MRALKLAPIELDGEWQTMFTQAQNTQLIVLPYSQLDNLTAINQGLDDGYQAWTIGLHWLYKKQWNKSHKIPYRQKLVKLLEPIGDYMWAIQQLAMDIHALGHPQTKQWENAGQWTGAIFAEMLTSDTQQGIERMLQGQGLHLEIKKVRELIQTLRDENVPSDLETTQPDYHTLLTLLMHYIKTGKYANLKKKYLMYSKSTSQYSCKGLVHALSKYAEVLESSNAMPLKVKKGTLYVSTKKGEISIKGSN